MDGGTLRLFWERVSERFNIGPYEDFKIAMGDPDRRKSFHTEISKSFNIGTFEEFELIFYFKLISNFTLASSKSNIPISIIFS